MQGRERESKRKGESAGEGGRVREYGGVGSGTGGSRGMADTQTPKPPPPPLSKKKQKPQLLPDADAWMPFGPGWYYQPGLKVLLPGLRAAATWSPFCPGS